MVNAPMRTLPLLVLTLLSAPGCIGPQNFDIAVRLEVVDVRHGDADISFRVDTGKGTAIVLEVTTEDGFRELLGPPDGVTAGMMNIGFLEPNTGYHLKLIAVEGARTGRATDTIETLPSPFAWAPINEAALRPGDAIQDGDCSLGFLLRDSSNETNYALTAGHCVKAVGDEVPLGDAAANLTAAVVHRGPSLEQADDWALLQFPDSLRSQASPAVRYWTGPTESKEVSIRGPTVCLHGVGPKDRYEWHRCGTLQDQNPDEPVLHYFIDSFAGDSGAPLLSHAAGLALGIHVSSNAFGDARGAALGSLLEEIEREGGPTLRVAAAPFTPPPADPLG